MRKFLSTVLYLAWGLPVLFGSLFLLGTRPWALDRELYRSWVTDKSLYEMLRSEELAQGTETPLELGDYRFDGPALTAAIQERLPEAELKELGSEAVDQALDFVEGKRENPIDLDLRRLKASLNGSAGAAAKDYVAALKTGPAPSDPRDLTVLPEGITRERAAAYMSTALSAAVAELPDRAVAETPAGERPALTQKKLDRTTFAFALLAAASVTALAFLAGGGGAAVLGRAAFMLGLPSALVMVFGILLALPGSALLARFVPPEASEVLGAAARGELRAFFSRALAPIAKGYFIWGLVGCSAAGLLLSLKRLFRRD